MTLFLIISIKKVYSSLNNAYLYMHKIFYYKGLEYYATYKHFVSFLLWWRNFFILVTTEIENFFMLTIFHMVNWIFSHQYITIFSKVLSSQIVYLDAIYTHFIKWMMLILNIKTLAFAMIFFCRLDNWTGYSGN